MNQTRDTRAPVYSEFFKGADGIDRITLTYPVLKTFVVREGDNNTIPNNRANTSSDYLGLVAVSTPVSKIFERFGNIFNIDTQFLVGYDKNGTIMITPRSEYVGKNFMSPVV